MIQTAIKKEDFKKYHSHPDEPIRTYPANISSGIKGLVCPDCGADIYAKSNHHGTSFYVLYPDGKHTTIKCKTLSTKNEKTIKSITHESFNPEGFLAGLIPTEPLIPDTSPKPKGPGSPGPGTGGETIDPEDVEFRPSSSIKDIVAENLHKEDPHKPIDKNSTELKSILLAVPAFKEFFNDFGQLSYTNRIIQMEPYNSDSNEECYIGRIFRYIGTDEKSNKKLYTYIYFKINIRDARKAFYNYYSKTFRRDADANGIMRNISNYENIFVAGYWEPIDPYRTKNGDEYPMFQTTIYDFGRQIYHFNKK